MVEGRAAAMELLLALEVDGEAALDGFEAASEHSATAVAATAAAAAAAAAAASASSFAFLAASS